MKEPWKELSKRRVIRVAVAYLVFAWVVLQVVDVVIPALGLPDWAITLVLVLLVAGFPMALVLSWLFDIGPGGITRTPKVNSETAELSIAVLPFPDLSAEQDQAYFCDGLTDELISWLARIPGLRVASRSSSFAFKGQNADLKSAAEKMQVAHILEGGVRKDGDRVRISAQLTDVTHDTVLWAENYDRELSDIFTIQQDLAKRIQDALQLQLGTIESVKPGTQNTRAYEYYLRARGYALYSGNHKLPLAQTMFEKAVQEDPGFSDAWVGLAEVTSMQAIFLNGGEEARKAADKAGQKAMELAPEKGSSFLAVGYGQLACECYAEAEEAFLKAVQLDANLYRAWHYLGRTAHHVGNREKEIEYFKRAVESDPSDWESSVLLLSPLKLKGDPEEIRKMARLAVGRVENHLEDYPDNQRAYYLGIGALILLGEEDRAVEWAEKAYSLAPDDLATRYNLACFYAQYGDLERSLDLLERSVSSRSWIEHDSDLVNLHGHPRFKRFMSSLEEGS